MIRVLKRWAGRARLLHSRCAVCSRTLAHRQADACDDCRTELRQRKGGACPLCGEMFGDGLAPATVCPECRHAPPPWDRFYFHGRYSGRLRDLVIAFKFSGSLGRTRLLASMAAEAFRNAERTPDVVVPVPLHARRLLNRGFNQSVELARALARKLDRPLATRALQRVPHTRLGHAERQANLKGAFRDDRAEAAGKIVLLVDDVYTTGATLKECARTLRRAGAAGVDVLVLARAQQEPGSSE